MARDLRAVRVGARVTAGLIAIAVAGVAITGASVVSIPRVVSTPQSTTVDPVPTAARRVCAGPLLALQSDDPNSAVSPVGDAPVTVSTGSGSGDAQLSTLTSANPEATGGSAEKSPQVATVPAAAGATTAPQISAAQSESASGESLSGFAASGCEDASSDIWIAGGSTTVGETSMLSLVNPDQVAATVDISVWSETGSIDAPGSQGIVVAPGSQKVIQLAALAPNVEAPVLQIRTTGGRVAAFVQQSLVSGITPQGAEIVGSTAAPATHQVIPGVQLDSVQAALATQTGDGYDVYLPALRILNTGTRSATVRIGIAPVAGSGASSGTTMQVTAKPGTVIEQQLNGVTAGEYTVTLESSAPVVASARTFSIGATSTDFAWFAAAQTLPDAFAVAVAPGKNPFLIVANPGTTARRVVIAGSGPRIEVTVGAGASTRVMLTKPGAYAVSGAQGVYADVGYASNGVSSSYLIRPPSALASPVTIYAH